MGITDLVSQLGVVLADLGADRPQFPLRERSLALTLRSEVVTCLRNGLTFADFLNYGASMPIWSTRKTPMGRLTYDLTNQVVVGDRLLYGAMDVEFDGVDGEPALKMHLEVRDDRPQCRSLSIIALEDGREVLPKDINAVDLPTWVENIFAAESKKLVSDADGNVRALRVDLTADEAWRQAVAPIREARRSRGARKLDDAHYRRVAEVYRASVGRSPTKTVAEEFGVKSSMAEKYVRAARDRGFLGAAQRGKAGER